MDYQDNVNDGFLTFSGGVDMKHWTKPILYSKNFPHKLNPSESILPHNQRVNWFYFNYMNRRKKLSFYSLYRGV